MFLFSPGFLRHITRITFFSFVKNAGFPPPLLIGTEFAYSNLYPKIFDQEEL